MARQDCKRKQVYASVAAAPPVRSIRGPCHCCRWCCGCCCRSGERRKKVRRRCLNIRTRKQPNRHIKLPPLSMASGRPRSKTSGIASKQENIWIYIDPLYYLRGLLGMAALRLDKRCHRNSNNHAGMIRPTNKK